MRFLRPALICVAAILLAIPASASDLQPIKWDDLVPEAEPIRNPLLDLTPDQREDLGYVARLKADLELGFITTDSDEFKEAVKLEAKLEEAGIDMDEISKELDAIEKEIERRGAEMVKDLDGTIVRLPGYALPLELTDKGVTEFLLVPYVGACIHSPPPPPNQTVFVETEKEFVSDSLYEPVWITGQIKIQPSSRSLTFVDGTADVATGYTIEAISIEPYK